MCVVGMDIFMPQCSAELLFHAQNTLSLLYDTTYLTNDGIKRPLGGSKLASAMSK